MIEKRRHITPEKAKKILDKHGIKITLEEAKLVLDYVYKLAKLSLKIYIKE